MLYGKTPPEGVNIALPFAELEHVAAMLVMFEVRFEFVKLIELLK
jgi:hypothetical protein